MPFASFKAFIEDAATKGQTLFARITDKATFERIVFACYLIGYADGDFDASEKQAVAKLIAKKFPHFDLSDIMAAIKKADEFMDFDASMGKIQILDEIGKSKGDAREAIMQASVMIGNADGTFDYDEKAVARTIAERMELNPRNYGLA